MSTPTGPDDTADFPLRPRGVGDIITAAFDLYRRNWATLMAVAAVVVVPLTLVQYYLMDVVARTSPTEQELQRLGSEAVTSDFVRATAGLFLVGILSIFILQVVTGAVARTAAGSILGDRLALGEAYRYGLRRLWSILLIGLLVGLAVMAGFLLLVIPGFFVLVRLISSVPVLVVENRRGRDALARSWDLARGHGWAVLGTLLVMALLTGVVNGILTVPLGDNWFGRAVGASIASVVTTPFTALVILLIYLDLRARKEELDVATFRADYEAAGAG